MTTKESIGHNSGINSDTKQKLKNYIEAIERFEAEKQQISENISEVFNDAKAAGFDVKTIRKVLKLRKSEESKLQEAEYLLTVYCEALDLPLFKSLL